MMRAVREAEIAELRRLRVAEKAGPPDLSHDGLALELGEQWREDARHVAAWGRWYFFDGTVWREDAVLEHMTRTRAFLRELAEQESDQRRAAPLRSSETVARVVGLARSNPVQAATTEQWDAGPMLLGTPGGTVDLTTGQLRPARASDYITKTTAVAPAPPGTPAPLWTRALSEIMAGDAGTVAYLQRFFGYSLTGSIREHAFAFALGDGANGKGLVANAMIAVLADYAMTIPTEMLMVSAGDSHPTELARLRGVRFAVGSETEEGRRWAEAKVKALTGGDRIAARFMRQDFFEFSPQFKLFVVGNHRPSLRGVDEAMRRRLHLIPFSVTIPPDQRDLDLPEKLEPEYPAILRWAIDGCLAWQREGLNPPACVRDSTEAYLEAEDAFGTWMSDCGTEEANAWEPSAALFNSWKRWAEAAGEYVGSNKRLAAELEKRGLRKERGSDGARGFLGLRLNPVADGAWSP